MARLVRDHKLETRTARSRLPIRAKPYFRRLEIGFHLGYRRLANGGAWIARRFAEDGRYREYRLGIADDTQDADGVAVLDYSHAQKAARQWWRSESRREEGYDPRLGPLTVADAIADYLKSLERRGGRTVYQSNRTAQAHILPALGKWQVAKLTRKHIEEWHHGLASQPPRVRSKLGAQPNYRKADPSPDGIRKRRASANRILSVLKAALNHAWNVGTVDSDDAWRRVRPFKGVDTARLRYLSEADCVRLVNACEPAFRNLVRGALLTGCRYSELAGLCAGDVNGDAGMITIRHSKAGKPRHVVLTEEAQRLFATLTADKSADDVIFTRAAGDWWGKSHQLRPMLQACQRANIQPAISFHILRHTHGSLLAMRGVPMAVIAEQLGHADTRMTEKHYAHLSPSYVADTIRAHFPTLNFGEEGDVVPFRARRG